MREDAVSDVMEVLEMYCSVVLERFSDLEKEYARSILFQTTLLKP